MTSQHLWGGWRCQNIEGGSRTRPFIRFVISLSLSFFFSLSLPLSLFVFLSYHPKRGLLEKVTAESNQRQKRDKTLTKKNNQIIKGEKSFQCMLDLLVRRILFSSLKEIFHSDINSQADKEVGMNNGWLATNKEGYFFFSYLVFVWFSQILKTLPFYYQQSVLLLKVISHLSMFNFASRHCGI